MSQHFIIRNHDGHYWGRGKRWVDGRETGKVAVFHHRDEAVNTLFELSSKAVDLRGEVLALSLLDNRLPALEISAIPLPPDPNAPELDLELAVSEHNIAEATVS